MLPAVFNMFDSKNLPASTIMGKNGKSNDWADSKITTIDPQTQSLAVNHSVPSRGPYATENSCLLGLCLVLASDLSTKRMLGKMRESCACACVTWAQEMCKLYVCIHALSICTTHPAVHVCCFPERLCPCDFHNCNCCGGCSILLSTHHFWSLIISYIISQPTTQPALLQPHV